MPRTSLVPLLFVLGCTTPPEQGITTAEINVGGGADCPKSECGTNSTVIDGVYFSDLHLFGQPNDAGVSLLGYFSLPPGAVRLDVHRNRLVAVNAAKQVVAQATGLIGTQLRLGIDAKEYIVRIADFHRTQRYWAADDNTPVETYKFEYVQIVPAPQSSIFTELCKSEASAGQLEFDAVVFEGDLYDAATKDIDTTPDPGWFNIACLGGAPAKQHLMRRTRASSDILAGITTSENERRALLNMWTGNYCGDGQSFTYTGQPILLRDKNGWIPKTSAWSWDDMSDLEPGEEFEAIWDENGAVCMNVPRLYDSEESVKQEILDWCQDVGHPLPPCSKDMLVNWKQHGYFLTANPAGS